MLLDLPCNIIHSVARFRLRAHTLRIETVTWTHNTSPTPDLWNAHDVQDEQHVLFHCTHPHVVSLRRTYASLFSSAGLSNVSAFLGQENNQLYFFHHALIVLYEQQGWAITPNGVRRKLRYVTVIYGFRRNLGI